MTSASWRFEAIGTGWEIASDAVLDDTTRAAVTQHIERFDGEWSRFRDDSLVSALGREGGSVPAPADAAAMLDAYSDLDAATSGAVNPLVGDVLARRGYGAGYPLRDGGAAPAKAWREVLAWDGGSLSVAEPALIDVGALGKGRLVDTVAALIAGGTTGSFVVDAGGDMTVRGEPVRVGFEHPYDPRRVIGVVELSDEALCASATNRRAWGEGLHHVLDARTGEPVRAYAATWAIAPTAMAADAVATALFFDGGPELAARWGVSWVRMTTTGSVEYSPGSRVEILR